MRPHANLARRIADGRLFCNTLLWDIIGKAAGQPIYKLLGAQRDRVLVYAATSRLLPPEELAQLAVQIQEEGFRAIKLRLHRPDPRDDLAAVAAVREAVSPDLLLLVDANQNNPSLGYTFWPRRTALQMARALDELGVYFLEEPLPRRDVEGLAEIARSVDMYIAGGEHSPTVNDFKEHVLAGAYDIIQPDVVMGGNVGITGIRKVAAFADYFGRMVVPHVLSHAGAPLCLSATLHAMATVGNCPMVEYPYDPPILTVKNLHSYALEPITVGGDGCVPLPQGPGLGVELDEDKLEKR